MNYVLRSTQKSRTIDNLKCSYLEFQDLLLSTPQNEDSRLGNVELVDRRLCSKKSNCRKCKYIKEN
jgi:hypothetical protein